MTACATPSASELIGLLDRRPAGQLGDRRRAQPHGPLALFFSVVATVWNYVYNIGVDKLLLRYQATPTRRCGSGCCTPWGSRGLLIVALPVMSWWLDIGLLEALVLDMGFVLFYLVYAFVYNWSYDKVFPIPMGQVQKALG